ncbi:hypothetical protein TrVE_jg11279 [Triparma verrucosa]|uniref:Uncharacterized protein n=1 Tax=Triparma verrucosa TaxID=1606542 RepID=A0A9W7FK43_9STRA|nr:hypothetical protein TrVE_jg11279 [Triparma verrucosa]
MTSTDAYSLNLSRRIFTEKTLKASGAALGLNTILTPSHCLALDLDDPPAQALSKFTSDTKPIVSLLNDVVSMLSADSTASDEDISKFVQSDLFPPLKTWALEWGYKPGLINYKKRAFAEPDSHKYLLSVFDELKKNVEQPKPGVPIKKLSAEEVVKLREMLETVNSSLS